jgi:hypothetical protein
VLLLLAWVTLWVIDVCYYSRLVRGAVSALIAIEAKTNCRLDFSHKVEEAVTRLSNRPLEFNSNTLNWQVKLFYLPVAAFLAAAAAILLYKSIY